MSDTIRLDKWLWQARFFKTRTLASKIVNAGHVRVNEVKVAKASYSVKVGDGLVFPQAERIRIVRIEALGERRGPASEAQTLYEDLTPEQERPTPVEEERVGGCPTKKDRRQMDALRRSTDPS